MKALNAKVSATRRKLTVYAFFKAFWPFLTFVAIFLAIALAGVIDRMGSAMAAVATILFLGGSILFILQGGRRYTPVSHEDATRLLDRQSDLRPVSSLTDRPASASRGSQKLWQKHRLRLLKEAQRLKLPSLSREWSRLDPYWMRAVLPALLVLMGVFAGTDASARLHRALFPDYGALVGADGMVVEAWITPPNTRAAHPFSSLQNC